MPSLTGPRKVAERPVGGTDLPPSPDAIPWRAIVLGAVVLPPLTLFGMYSYVIIQTATWMGDSILRGPLFLLFLLVLINLLLRKFGRRWAMQRGELLLIYAMTSLGTALVGV